MSPKTLDSYRKELDALAGRLNISLAHDQREVMREDEPDVPGGPMPSTGPEANAGEVEIEVGVIANEVRLAAEVAAALKRIQAGTYGQCQTCGKAIGRKRLDAVPYARRCIGCARASEVAVPR